MIRSPYTSLPAVVFYPTGEFARDPSMSDKPLGSAATLAVTPKTESELLGRVGYIANVSFPRREQTLHAFLHVSSETYSIIRGESAVDRMYVSFVSNFLFLDFRLRKPNHMHEDG